MSTTRTAIYTRISADKTGKELGVTRQTDDCQALASRLGWQVVQTFTDNDLSAYNGKTRPAFEKMLAAMKAGEFEALICWHTDRLYRSMKDLERLIDIADEHRVQLRTVQGGDLDLSNASGRMLARILGSVSRQESEHKGERQRAAAKQKAKKGKPQWKHAFGYLPDTRSKEDDDGTRQPDPQTAPLVRQAYAAVLAGSSLKDIARLFNDAEAYGIHGRPWSQPTVSLFLRKPRNAGLRTYDGEIVEIGVGEDRKVVKGTWKPLVDESMWRSVQAVLNAPGRAPGRKSVKRHLLTAVLQCGKPGCGGYLSGLRTAQKTGGKSGRPKAGEKKTHGGELAYSIAYQCKSCRGVSIRAEHIEPLVYRVVGDRLAMDDAIDLLKAECHDSAEAEQIRLEMESLYGELDNIGTERGEGLLTGKQAKIATDIVDAKITTLQARQQDSERLRVFEGLPLGKAEVHDAVKSLSADRFRAVLGVLCSITILPCGKGKFLIDPETNKRIIDPQRVQFGWH